MSSDISGVAGIACASFVRNGGPSEGAWAVLARPRTVLARELVAPAVLTAAAHVGACSGLSAAHPR